MSQDRKPPIGPDADPAQPSLRAKGTIDEPARRRLGQSLRVFYAGILNEPLPDRFARLVEALGRDPEIASGTEINQKEG